jgi:hypothetical protein
MVVGPPVTETEKAPSSIPRRPLLVRPLLLLLLLLLLQRQHHQQLCQGQSKV